jgi:hypothetical protein
MFNLPSPFHLFRRQQTQPSVVAQSTKIKISRWQRCDNFRSRMRRRTGVSGSDSARRLWKIWLSSVFISNEALYYNIQTLLIKHSNCVELKWEYYVIIKILKQR